MMLILVPPTVQGDVLGQDGDAALALQVVGVEDAVPVELALAEQAGLAHHLIDQRRLAVVDVGDDGHVANVITLHTLLFSWNLQLLCRPCGRAGTDALL